MVIESSLGEILLKVGMFVLVQFLVYSILSNSSSIFSKNIPRSLSFRPARSATVRQILAALSDVPAGGEPSPSPRESQSQLSTTDQDEYSASGKS